MSRVLCKVSEKMSYCAINMIIMSRITNGSQGTQGALGKQLTLINISLLSLMIAIKGHASWSPDKTYCIYTLEGFHSDLSLILKWRFE